MGSRLVRAAAALIADTSWSADGRSELYHALNEELGKAEFKRLVDEYARPIVERQLIVAVGMLRSWGYTVEPPPKGDWVAVDGEIKRLLERIDDGSDGD